MNTPSNRALAPSPKKRDQAQSLVARFASRLGVEPEKMLATLRATAFRTGKNDAPVSNEEMLALLVVAQQYRLNPFTKEIYAFRGQNGGIMPLVGIDGWIRLVQEQKSFNGFEFRYDDEGEWVECTIHRKDREHPFTVREYLEECRRDTGPWKTAPKRMLRHRAIAQCARVAFGFGGIYEADEGEAIALAAGVDLLPTGQKPHTEPPISRTAEEPFATEDQLLEIRERLSKTTIEDTLVLAKFEVGGYEELRSNQVPAVLKFIDDNA